jgi:hypothetical protein
MKEYFIIIPVVLNLEKRLEKHPPNFIYCKDYFLWLIGEIIKKTAYKLESEEKNIWIPLCSQITKKHPYSYRNHLRYLCDNFPSIGNVLFRNDYRKGSCYSYRLAPYYFSEPVVISTINDKKMLKFLLKEKLLESNNKFKKNYNFLGKYFNEKLTINHNEANSKNIELFKKNLDYRKHLLNAIQIKEIANRDFSIKYTHKTDGRLHHQITRLSKDLRKFLKYDGEELAECDLSASVPTILSYTLLNILNSNSIPLNSVINKTKLYYSHYMFCKNAVPLDIREIELFSKKILTGQFYESFIDGMHSIHNFDKSLKQDEYFLKNVENIFGREFDGDTDDLRKVMKKNILSMFNSKPAQYLNEEAEFNMHYSSILKWMKTFKKNNHKYFSYLTLQLESYFILEVVARQFNNKHKGEKPLFTLHDCLITTKSNIEELYGFMRERLSETLKFTPILKIEEWS